LLTSAIDGMRSSFYRGLLTIAVVLMTVRDNSAATRRPYARAIAPQPPVVSAETRLLVVAPHPDDEVLAAGGLMQQVHEAGGTVRVVYLTNGDGYRDGVRLEQRAVKISAKDFRGYGRRRQREARAALEALGLDGAAATFLSFPDQGLCRMTRTYWSDSRRPYRSPYTRLDRPPLEGLLVPDTEYRGEDLTLELAQLISQYRPTLIVVPRREDEHPDHSAASFFLLDALTYVRRVLPDYNTDVLNYIVHFKSWPFEDERIALPPPPGLSGGVSGWIQVPLTPAEMRAKRDALRKYRTQQHAMKWFLDAFVRSNEVFSRPAPSRVVLPLKHSSCS
jgi:LmbE family N-acetylglucosaminyl deacetylase